MIQPGDHVLVTHSNGRRTRSLLERIFPTNNHRVIFLVNCKEAEGCGRVHLVSGSDIVEDKWASNNE